MINLENRLIDLQKSLRERSADVCGTAPKWIIDSVLEEIDALVAAPSNTKTQEQYHGYLLGVFKFIMDQRCHGDCERIADVVYELVESTNEKKGM